ncbi:MAG: hypothetical protein ACTSRU_08275, partial [Candidatus Hodarchaeales archaeon]
MDGSIESDKTLLLTFPIRDRADILTKYDILGHILRQDYPKNLIGLYFIIHEKQKDDTEKIIREFQDKNKDDYKEIKVENVCLGTPEDRRTSSWRRIIRKSLRKLYDRELNYAASSGYNYCILMGSDTQLISTNLFSSIISRGKDFIAPMMLDGGSDKVWNSWKAIPGGYKNMELRRSEEKLGILEVGGITGIFMISKRLLELGVRYGTRGGEDFGFCEDVIDKGKCKLWVDLDVLCRHQPALKERD